MEPLAAIPLAFLFLSETPSFVALFGGILILFSGYLVIRSRFTAQAESGPDKQRGFDTDQSR